MTPVNLQQLTIALEGLDTNIRQYLLEGFSKGFHTGFEGPIPRPIKEHTLRSALQNPTIVLQKINSEIAAGRVLGPYNQPPIQNYISSPIGLVPKKTHNEYRLIHHLSYPHGKSVNDGIPDQEATVQYTTIDDAIQIIRELGAGCFMAKTDIQKAFRLIPISPEEHHLLGFTFQGLYYIDTCLPMGLKSSCRIFETFSSAIEQIARYHRGITHIIHLLDDFLIIAKSSDSCNAQLQAFLVLCSELGIPIAKEKTFDAATTMTFLGIELDTVTFEARLPQEKLVTCREAIQKIINQPKATLRQLQQITGILNFACQVIIPGRAFLRRLIDLSIGLSRPFQHVRITSEARQDLQAWLGFLVEFNGKTFFNYPPWIEAHCIHLYTDASGAIGYGAILGTHWFFGKWPEEWKTQSIAFLELFPIMASIVLWATELENKRLIIHTDNEALEYILNKSTSKNPRIMTFVRKLVTTCMCYNIHIRAQHIPGKINTIADCLSRSQIAQFRLRASWADQHPTVLPHHIQPSNWCPH